MQSLMSFLSLRRKATGASAPDSSISVTIEPFGWDVYIVTDPKEMEALEEGLSQAHGFVTAKKGVWYMGLPKKLCYGTLYHEAHHLARYMNDHAGIVTTNECHEADTYLMESIARIVAKAVYNRTIK